MSFQLSHKLDSNKVFLLKRSELEGRLDSHFYKSFFRRNEQRIKQIRYEKLGNLASFSSESWNQKDIFPDIFPYIEISGIDLLSGEILQINHLPTKDAPSRAKMIIRKNDILVSTTRPNRGAISHYKNNNPCIASTGFSVIREISVTSINREFLFYWLRQSSSLLQMEQRSSGGNYPAITQDELGKVKIPIPTKEIQNKIIAKMDVAYAAKKQKEMEAQRLLDSVDGYLLSELGIALPEQEENAIQNRIFTRRLSEISGGRTDPNFHLNVEFITRHKANFEFIQLKYILKHPPQYGANEAAVEGVKGSGTRYIRITDISEIGELNNNSWKTAKTIKDQYLLDYNDLLFARSGSVGKVYLHKDISEEAIYAGYLIRYIIDEKKADPNYIFFYCHSIIYKFWVKAIFRPAVQANINAEEYKSLPVVLPPIEKQTEIATHITSIRNQAKKLQQQAGEGLKQARKEAEAMILGEL